MSDQVRVRFAPSPTGHLHIGGLRSAIFNWLFAKKNNGKFLIRIEDTDTDRSKDEYTRSIIDSFAWLSIESDEPVFKQTDRLTEHVRLVQQLLDEGKAYRCFCSRREYTEIELEEGTSYTRYERVCLNRVITEEDLQKPHVIRFKLPDFTTETFVFQDQIYGDVSYPVDQFDDFIILRSNGQPVYNFVVVADDMYQRITHVIRGQDHLVNTPKQIMLYQAFNHRLPLFAHLPLILGPSGAKLSKREAATSVMSYKEEGFLPDALFNYLVRLGWSHGDQEIFTRQELITLFDIKDVNRAGAIFDIKKLEWLNGVYIRGMTDEQIAHYISQYIDTDFLAKTSLFSHENLLKVIALYKDRVKTLKELHDELILLNDMPTVFDVIELQAYTTVEVAARLKIVEDSLSKLVAWNETELATLIKDVCKQMNIKLPDIAKPLRLALTGKTSSPGIFELLAALSKNESLKRIGSFINKITM